MPSSGRIRGLQEHREIEVANLTRSTVLGTHIGVAENALSRAIGLLGQLRLDPGGGLLIDPSSGIHTFGMRFPIDVIALDRDFCVRGLWRGLGPFRVAALSWKTSCVLELPVGAIEESDTQLMDQLVIRNPGDLALGCDHVALAAAPASAVPDQGRSDEFAGLTEINWTSSACCFLRILRVD
jgi:uncharacterized membrane protein (UPF0127 family)